MSFEMLFLQNICQSNLRKLFLLQATIAISDDLYRKNVLPV